MGILGYCEGLQLDANLSDLDLDSKSQGCEKAKTDAPVFSQSSSWI